MHISETRKGELSILSEALIWSLFPIVTIVSLTGLSPVLSLAYSTLFAGVFFGCVMIWRGKTHELFLGGIIAYMVPIAFFIGWLFYGLYFSALKFTTSGNASI